MTEYKKRYKSRRQRRYVQLRESGFLAFEAEKLSLVPKTTPYLNKMVKDREKLQRRANRKGWTPGEYSKSIKLKYHGKGFVNKQRRQKLDVWQMLREYEYGYEQTHPNYNSPWLKRKKRFGKFLNVFEEAMTSKNLIETDRMLRERRKK